MQKLNNTVKHIYFALEVKNILWRLTSVSHILTVSIYQVCSNDGLNVWPVYAGERSGPHGPLIIYLLDDFVLEQCKINIGWLSIPELGF